MPENKGPSEGTTREPGFVEGISNTLMGVSNPVEHTTTDSSGNTVVGHGSTAAEARQDAVDKSK